MSNGKLHIVYDQNAKVESLSVSAKFDQRKALEALYNAVEKHLDEIMNTTEDAEFEDMTDQKKQLLPVSSSKIKPQCQEDNS